MFRGVGYTFEVPKRPCTNRAAWRLVRGQSAQHLSANYQLDCDYGTALLGIYKEGDAVFLCEAHATALNRLNGGSIAGVQVIGIQSPDANDSHESEKQAQGLASTGESPHAAVNGNGTRIRKGSRTTDVAARPAVFPVPPATRAGPDATRPAGRSSDRDPTFGNCAKGLVDESIWNLAPGNFGAYRSALQQGRSAAQAAEAAGGQLEIVHCKIKEYILKIETILSESKATVGASDVIEKPLEEAMLGIIDDGALNEAEKDAAIEHLGRFQERLSNELGRQLSPLEAFRLAQSIGNSANWGIARCAVEELKPAYGAVFRSLKTAILSTVPGAQPLDERLINLCAARCSLEIELNEKFYSVAT
jgi:hypothetical protein